MCLIYLSEDLSYPCLPAAPTPPPQCLPFFWGSRALFLHAIVLPEMPFLHPTSPLCFFLTQVHQSFKPHPKASPQATDCVPCLCPSPSLGMCLPRCPAASVCIKMILRCHCCLSRHPAPLLANGSRQEDCEVPLLIPKARHTAWHRASILGKLSFYLKGAFSSHASEKSGRLTPHCLTSSCMIYNQKVTLMSPVFRSNSRETSFLALPFLSFFSSFFEKKSHFKF